MSSLQRMKLGPVPRRNRGRGANVSGNGGRVLQEPCDEPQADENYISCSRISDGQHGPDICPDRRIERRQHRRSVVGFDRRRNNRRNYSSNRKYVAERHRTRACAYTRTIHDAAVECGHAGHRNDRKSHPERNGPSASAHPWSIEQHSLKRGDARHRRGHNPRSEQQRDGSGSDRRAVEWRGAVWS